jgi:hypothetical protein
VKAPAAEQGDEPVEALELKILHDDPIVTNVRFADYRHCSADVAGAPREAA